MYLKQILVTAIALIFTVLTGCQPSVKEQPNIFIAIADDWSWPHASIAGAKEIKTPAFDHVAENGVLFTHSFCSAPSCTPSRGAILTGQYHWRLEVGGNLWSTLPKKFDVFPEILEENGYFAGYTGKGWGPGDPEPGGRNRNPAGTAYQEHKLFTHYGISENNYFANFRDFLGKKPDKNPFCFWYGSFEPHRTYQQNRGIKTGKDPSEVKIPGCLPGKSTVRNDILDYFVEVEWFDTHLDSMLQHLDKTGELDNTLVIVTSDNGMPFPGCKSNLYDMGTRMPLAIMWGNEIKSGRVVNDLVSLTDLAPTILEAAGIPIPENITGKSLMNILHSSKEGKVDTERNFVLTGKERHAWVRKGGTGYPTRAIRTHNFLYIRNYKPDRWPAGDPEDAIKNDPSVIYGDIDDSPTKQFMLNNRDDKEIKQLFHHDFEKRQGEELYDLTKDPEQINNVADDPAYRSIKDSLRQKLLTELKQTGDPRVRGRGDIFDRYPYHNKWFQPEIDPDSSKVYTGQGIIAGEITDTSVILQSRLTATRNSVNGDMQGTGGIARFEISRDTTFENTIRTSWQLARPEQDYIVRENITGLQPGSQYYYRLIFSKTATYPKYSKTGHFRTLPGKNSDNTAKLVVVTGMNYNKFHYGKNGDPDHPGKGSYSGPDKSFGYPALETIRKINSPPMNSFLFAETGTGNTMPGIHLVMKNSHVVHL